MVAADQIRQELRESAPHAAFVRNKSVAVLLPCYNEAASVAGVVEQFRRALPGAEIYVYDNNSTDGTAEVAAAAGAVVRHEPYQGKGAVVRRMFADIEADIYLMADGDLTYDATAAGGLIDVLVSRNLDMVVGVRQGSGDAYRPGHRFGNLFFNAAVRHLFGAGFTDILSGYRVLSRRFAKSFPADSAGFEVETELSVHALDLRLAWAEVPLAYGARPENSVSKLRTYRDGARIMMTIVMMYRALKPFRFYGLIAAGLGLVSLMLGVPIVIEWLRTGLVPRLPTAVLSATVMQMAFLSLTAGVIVDAVSQGRREMKRMRYLDLSAPIEAPRRAKLEQVAPEADEARSATA